MKLLAVVNPVSGQRSLAGVLHEAADRLRALGWGVSIRRTRAAGDALRLAREAPEDTRAILAVGGDGTVREVVDGLVQAGRAVPIAVLPTGTENLVAKEFCVPREADGLVRLLTGGRPVSTDVGAMNGRHFLTISGAGFDGEVVRRLTRSRNGHITHFSYFWPITRTFAAHRFPRVRVLVDGQEAFHGPGLVFVAISRRYSVGLQICHRAVRDDGLLDVCVYPCDRRAVLLGHAWRTFLRCHDRPGRLVYRQGRRIRLESDGRVPVQVDGDAGGFLPAQYEVLPSQVTFLAPAKPDSHH